MTSVDDAQTGTWVEKAGSTFAISAASTPPPCSRIIVLLYPTLQSNCVDTE